MRKSYKKAVSIIIEKIEGYKFDLEIAEKNIDNYIKSNIHDEDKFQELLRLRGKVRCEKFTLEMLLKYDLDEFDNKYFNR